MCFCIQSGLWILDAEAKPMDVVFVVITFLFFALSFGLIKVCERLMGGEA